MRIGILTHYDVNNQGAQLQLYALSMQLKMLGHIPIVLTYRKNFDFDPKQELRNNITIASVPYILKNFLFKKGLTLTIHNLKKYVYNKRFRMQNFTFGNYCKVETDAALVGADEVLSLQTGVNIMMYGHCVNTKNMIAYAPSFGQTTLERINECHCWDLIASGLANRFEHLSARDENTRDIIHKLTGKNPTIVCDPVLLYKFPLQNYSLPKNTPSKKYIVVYSYDSRFIQSYEIMAIKEYAHNHKLKTVSVGTFHKWCDVNIACNCLQWLKCIQEAQCVITDTFHGTIAAAITNRPMVISYSPTENSSKMLDLINRLGLKSRLMETFSYTEIERILSSPMDMDSLNDRIENLRESSLKYIMNALNELA